MSTSASRDIPCVLIVDDEDAIAEALSMLVEDAGYRPVIAQNGRAALAAMETCTPKLIFTDLMMPQMDGAQLIAILRSLAAEGCVIPPIVIMSAAAMVKLTATGADAVLRKPFDVVDVEVLLERYLHP